MSLKDDLDRLTVEKEQVEKKIAAIYRASVEAPESEKVGPDTFAAMLGEEDSHAFIKYPTTIHGITHTEGKTVEPSWRGERQPAGAFVAVRPVGEEHKGKTFLGIYLGDIATEATCSLHQGTGVLAIGLGRHNPALWVPDLKRIVFGYESWWGVLRKPEDLRQITNADIQGVWYVQALRSLEGGQTNAGTP